MTLQVHRRDCGFLALRGITLGMLRKLDLDGIAPMCESEAAGSSGKSRGRP
jgi:hypothetical protein